MPYFGVAFCIFSLSIDGLFCSANDLTRLKARVKLLETRLNSEVFFRDGEYAEIAERLDDIDNVINIRERPDISEASKISNLDYETVDLLKEDYARIRKAFREEKTERERIRREIPRIENNLITINEHVENYHQRALNQTGLLLTSFEASRASEKRIFLDVIEKFETVTNNTKCNMKMRQDESRILQKMSANDRKISEQIENLERIVTNKFLHIESLLLHGDSCLYLKNMGKKVSGVYKLRNEITVYCDLVTEGGGWTVFQRRLNGEVDFYRNWTEYKNGFGDLNGEFWLGNDHLRLLTADGNNELRIEMEDFDGNTAYAKYSKFKIYPEEDKYKLEVSGYSGTAGHSLKYHNGMMFSTFDSDNDKSMLENCADKCHGAWWYNNCIMSNLNGKYYKVPVGRCYSGINWNLWRNIYECLKKVEMKLR